MSPCLVMPLAWILRISYLACSLGNGISIVCNYIHLNTYHIASYIITHTVTVPEIIFLICPDKMSEQTQNVQTL